CASSAAGVPAPSVLWTLVFAGLVLGILATRGMYGARLHHELLEDLRSVVIATSLAGMIVLPLRELIAPPSALSAQVIRTWAFATAYVAGVLVALHWSKTQEY